MTTPDTFDAGIEVNGWISLEPLPGKLPHVMPINDLREHVESNDCWCSPTEDDGVMVHHSMDRREEYERGRRSS